MAATHLSLTSRSTGLGRALQSDAVVCGVAGVSLLAAASPLATLTGLPVLALGIVGGLLLPYAAWLWYVATRPTISRRVGWGVAIFNSLWVLDSALLLFTDLVPLTSTGWWLVLAQALVVLALAEWQFLTLYKSR